MSKKISLSIIAILIVLFGGYTIYWFAQANNLEKQTMGFINSYGKNSARSVSVSGFPLKNILTIKDLKIVSSDDSAKSEAEIFNPTLAAFRNSDYTFEISTAQFSNKLFTDNVSIENIGDIKIQKGDKDPYLLKFNQSPVINLVFDRNLVTKIDYHDKGYRIFDAQNNEIIKIDSDSRLISDLIARDDKFYGTINIASTSVTSGDFNRLSAIFDDKEQTAKTPSDSQPTKHELIADIEYVLLLQEKPQSKNDLYKMDKFKIESLNIKNIKITNPTNKIILNGNLGRIESEDNFFYNLTINFESFDNIINDIKKIYKEIKDAKENKPDAIQEQNNGLISNTQNPNISEPINPAKPSANLAVNAKPKIDMVDAIIDFTLYVASQNPASNDKNATFNFKKDTGSKVVLINSIPFDQLFMQFFMMISASKETKSDQIPVIEQNNNSQILQ